MAGRLARVRSKADSALDGHRYESTDSSDDEAMRAVPAGCLGRTGVRLVAEARAGEDERGRTGEKGYSVCLLYTSPSPRDATLSRMPSSA